MSAQINHIQTTRTSRYFSLEIGPSEAENLWIVLHGYGQNAEYFIQHFRDFKPKNSLIIAPEGLSKFYLNGFDGRVGASWMTKEDRENEIADQLIYLDNLLAKIDPNASLKLNLLGFSQGAAVACRWYQKTNRKVENLVIWGAGLPIETDANMAHKYEACNTLFVLGDQDEFIKEERLTQYYQTLQDLSFRHSVITYKGAHKLEKEGFEKLKSILNSEKLL